VVEEAAQEEAMGLSLNGAMTSALNQYPDNFDSAQLNLHLSSKLNVLECLLKQIKSSGGKVVVVSNYRTSLDVIQLLCEHHQWGFLRLDGSTVAAKRHDMVERFNAKWASENFVFLLSAKAGGFGLVIYYYSFLHVDAFSCSKSVAFLCDRI
jgi:DNA repair and recombination protein RAD54B